jgi:murein DD-endopeptidase MepM/ murein hydrolase activator NlpD
VRESRPQENVTLLYMPGQTGRVRRFSLRRIWFRRVAIGAGVFCVALCALLVDYVKLRSEVDQLPALRAQARQQREQIDTYTEKLQSIKKHLESVAALDRKLRVITNLQGSDPLPLHGVGGIDETLEASVELGPNASQRRDRRIRDGLELLSGAAQAQAGSLTALLRHLEDQRTRLAATPSISPARGWITSTFGYRTSPFTGVRELHRGLDIAARMRTPVIAPADGQVLFAGDRSGYGISVTVRHGFGLETIYGHLAEVLVKPGQRVTRGTRLGLIGNTGRSTGPHLHYQVQVNGQPVDPQNYMLD